MAESVFDVLCVADMYLLPGLKRLCGKILAQTLCKDNVVYMWKTAKLFQLSRLEDQCVEYMAKIIYQVSVADDLSWGLWCVRSFINVCWWCIHTCDCRSSWSSPSSQRPSKRTQPRWRSDRTPTPSPWWTRSASTSPATCKRIAKSKRPTRNWRPWRSFSSPLIFVAEEAAGRALTSAGYLT